MFAINSLFLVLFLLFFFFCLTNTIEFATFVHIEYWIHLNTGSVKEKLQYNRHRCEV